MSGTLKVGVGDEASGARRFVEAWQAVQAGQSPAPVELLLFEDMQTLLRALTAERWRLLEVLKDCGPESVRGLSRRLGRDYKNVHGDVRILEAIGLLERSDEGRLLVPWDAVVAELRLAA